MHRTAQRMKEFAAGKGVTWVVRDKNEMLGHTGVLMLLQDSMICVTLRWLNARVWVPCKATFCRANVC